MKEYPDKIRKITFYDEEHERELVFITNNVELEATEIALLYKKRWMVDYFGLRHLRIPMIIPFLEEVSESIAYLVHKESKKLQKSSAKQNISITLLLVNIAIKDL